MEAQATNGRAVILDRTTGTVEQSSSALTQKPKKIYGKKYRCWLGTWNSFPVDYLEKLKFAFCDFVCQEEIGDSGNHHIQFAGRTNSPRALSGMIKTLPGAHLENADNWHACISYCKKEKTYVPGTRFEFGKPSEPPIQKGPTDPMDGLELRYWQECINDILKRKPDNRKIHCFFDETGNSGKTTFSKHLCIKYPGTLYLTGKAADMKFAIAEFLENGNKLNCVILDFARSQEEFISYQGIEEIKNGIFFSTKYKSGMIIYDTPHIFMFTNFIPKFSALSTDRWDFMNISLPTGFKHEDINPEVDSAMDEIYLKIAIDKSLGIIKNREDEKTEAYVIKYYDQMQRMCNEEYWALTQFA